VLNESSCQAQDDDESDGELDLSTLGRGGGGGMSSSMFANKRKGNSRLNIGGGGFTAGLLGGASFDVEASVDSSQGEPTRSAAAFMAASRDEFDDDF
jgi:glutamate-1-semialdehyde aminotransferase